MELSDQQNAVVMHGMEKGNATWEPRELPTQVRDLPDWLLDAHVDMMLHACNSPDVKLKVSRNPWPQNELELYEDEGGGAWTARSSDGYVLHRHYHSGRVREYTAWRVMYDGKIVTKAHRNGWQIPVIQAGETAQIAAEREAEKHVAFCKDLDGRLNMERGNPDLYSIEYSKVLATDKQNGYGGANFSLMLKDGRTIILRGPWHGGSPVGWNDTVIVDMSSKYNQEPLVYGGKTQPWYKRGGSYGHYLSDELILKAVARFQPHVDVAMVYPGYGHARYEFYDRTWGAPKMFAKERLRGWGPAK